MFERSVGTTGGGNNYRLTHLGASTGSFVSLSYKDGVIRNVSDADGPVFEITRDRRGRINSIQDRWGRDVYYRYDASGKLSEAVDIAGNAWTYEYAAHGQLTRAIGPNERDILRIAYDEMARVRESLSGRQYFFTYTPAETMVSEGTGHSHVFGHNAVGVTDRFDSTNGIWWQLELDERNRVTVIQSSRGGYRYTYGAQGEITNAIETTANGSDTRTYQHDDAGRIASVYSQDGAIITIDYAGGSTRINGPQAQFSFEVLLSGEIAQVEQDGTLVRADYDADGNLAAFHSRADTVQFNQDLAGRISAIQYADGEINQYRYDQLGNRSSIEFGMGGTVRYKHDPAGNIVEVAVTERNGEEKRQSVRIGDMNRVENITYQGIGKLDIAYDRMGRAISFDTGGDVISVEYAGPDRIGRIISRATGATWSPTDAQASEQNLQEVTDARVEVFQNDSTGSSHPDYGIAAFEESSIAAIARDPMSLGVPGLLKARQVLAVAKPLFLGNKQDAMMAFEKPSNAVFQPLEYRSTNCCICIIYYPKSVTSRPVPKDHDDDDDGETDLICICLPEPPPPAPPCIPPPFFNPLPALTPATDRVPLVNSGRSWGRTVINANEPVLVCQDYCDGDMYRLEGNVTFNYTTSYVKVSTKVLAPNCRQSERTSTNIDRTIAHEQTHAWALVDVINDYRAKLGSGYSSLDDCNRGKKTFVDSFNSAFQDEETRQISHADFKGQKMYVAECRNRRSREVWLGDRY